MGAWMDGWTDMGQPVRCSSLALYREECDTSWACMESKP
jgi:hypothetical protein